MGAGGFVDAASLPATLSRDQAKARVGERWVLEHEGLFQAFAGEDGTVTKEQFMQGHDQLQSLVSAEPTLPLPLHWESQILCHASAHVLGLFLDRYSFAALAASSPRMQKSLRNVIRARNDLLPEAKKMADLGGAFCVWKRAKELLKWEGKTPWKELCAEIVDKMGEAREARIYELALFKIPPPGIMDVLNAVAICLETRVRMHAHDSHGKSLNWQDLKKYVIYNNNTIKSMRNFSFENFGSRTSKLAEITRKLKPIVELEDFKTEHLDQISRNAAICREWVLAFYAYASRIMCE